MYRWGRIGVGVDGQAGPVWPGAWHGGMEHGMVPGFSSGGGGGDDVGEEHPTPPVHNGT